MYHPARKLGEMVGTWGFPLALFLNIVPMPKHVEREMIKEMDLLFHVLEGH